MISENVVAITQWAGVAWSLNMMLGSTLFMAVFLLLRKRLLKTESRGLIRYLGLMTFACLALLPLQTLFVFDDALVSAESFALFEVKAFASTNPLGDGLRWSVGAVALYAIPVVLLLGRFVLALSQLWWARRRLSPCNNRLWFTVFSEAAQAQGISRDILLCESDSINTPMTFGWLRPVIVMPTQARSWSGEMIKDVFTHELVHIRRLDWLSLIFVYGIASVYWMNPLVWIMYAKFSVDTEASCDEEVLLSGREVNGYAQSLVSAARESGCHHLSRGQWLGQTMLDRSQLEQRVNYLMENDMNTITKKKSGSVNKGIFALLGAIVFTSVLSSVTLVAAQPADSAKAVGTFVPLNTIEPRYPTVAAEQSIEGWVHVRFTVNSLGSVQDIEVIEAEPAEIFNQSAIAAADQFKFTQPNVEGHPVDVPNVQYVFRYVLSNDSDVGGPTAH